MGRVPAGAGNVDVVDQIVFPGEEGSCDPISGGVVNFVKDGIRGTAQEVPVKSEVVVGVPAFATCNAKVGRA
jgi:hypothetical protein